MTKRGLLATSLLVLLTPQTSRAQGVAVDHKEIKCIVAGKYTRVTSCFEPQTALARGRAYFRAAGTQPWYFVEFKADTPCFSTFFPKAKPDIKNVEYYVEGLGRDSNPNRTADFDPIVVKREEDCKDRPVAPFANKATVVVGALAGGPAVPAGFIITAGVGTTAIIAGSAGAAAVVGAAVAVGGGGNNPGGPPPPPPPPPSVTPPTQPPPTSGPPPTAAYQFVPVFAISPDPPVGTEPYKVTFDMCDSKGEALKFRFDFDGDGVTDLSGTACSASRFYSTGGVSASGGAPPPPPTPTTLKPRKAFYLTTMRVNDDRGNNASQNNTVEVVEALKADDESSAPVRRLAWSSELDLEGGSGQVVVNGSSAVFAPKGRSTAVAVGRRGENRVEALVVQGAGKAGTWRFELGGTTSFRSGSLRIVAGEVALVTADAVVFHLTGKPGERVVFTFRTEE
jgi:hypothetical protein